MADGSLPPEDSATAMDVHPPLDPTDGVRMTAAIRESYTDSGLPVINQYIRGPMIGKGQHGDVYLAWDLLHEKQPVAIKSVRRRNPRAEKMKKLRRPSNMPSSPHIPLSERLSSTEQKIRKEIAIMKKLRHAHIVRLLEVIDDKLYSRIFMVMEFLGGGEVKWRDRNGRPVLHVDQSRRIIRDVILGLEYLHYQGIIHRDIKPANLMYTSDRRAVKITDFGVSHFSYAQRLAAAGQRKATGDASDDSILMDESDLSRTAGTPAFMAPEVIYEIGTMSADGQTSVTPLTPPKRQISKAIDVWALGVTLYCLLFGTTPFFDEDMNEYPVYQMICNQDWDLPATMGSDKIESGPRHPPKTKHDTEGNIVVRLLERLLEKDAEKRITLDQVKRHPWFLRDIPNPDAWIRETSPSNEEQVTVTEDDASDAMSDVRFRWTKRLTRPISNLWKTVRTQRSFRSRHEEDDDDFNRIGQRSAPHVMVTRAKSTGSRPPTATGSLEKGKARRLAPLAPEYKNESSPDVISHMRSRSTDRLPSPRHQSAQIAGSFGKARRGSETLLVPRPRHALPPTPRSAHSASPTASSIGDDSPYGGKGSADRSPDEPSRNRFSLSSWIPTSLRPSRHTSYGPAPHEASTSTSTSAASSPRGTHVRGSPIADLYARRSEEAFTIVPKRAASSEKASESLTAARRASSWGETAEYMRHSEDVTSVHSADQWESAGVDKEVMHLGAGGILLNEPLHPAASAVRLVTGSSPPSSYPLVPLHPQTERLFGETGDVPPAADPAIQDLVRQAQVHPRSHTTSPLAQVYYSDNRYQDFEDDSSSFFGRNSDDEERPTLNTSQMYNEEDEESDDEAITLEVRRRRPSVSVTMASSPPPPDSSEE